METFSAIIQIIIPFGILNVWLLRSRRATNYRGGEAATLQGEFTVYGLPKFIFYTVGTLKLSAAAMLLLGFFLPDLVIPGAALMSALMLGALVMHAKTGDPAIRYLPAGLMLFMSLFLLF